VTPEAVLKLVLNLQSGGHTRRERQAKRLFASGAVAGSGSAAGCSSVDTSLAWLAVAGRDRSNFPGVLQEKAQAWKLLPSGCSTGPPGQSLIIQPVGPMAVGYRLSYRWREPRRPHPGLPQKRSHLLLFLLAADLLDAA